jgi:hypothetical protein
MTADAEPKTFPKNPGFRLSCSKIDCKRLKKLILSGIMGEQKDQKPRRA